jgi:hypothetical protein
LIIFLYVLAGPLAPCTRNRGAEAEEEEVLVLVLVLMVGTTQTVSKVTVRTVPLAVEVKIARHIRAATTSHHTFGLSPERGTAA